MVYASDDVSVLRLYDLRSFVVVVVFCFLAEKTVAREGGEASVDCEDEGPVCAPLQICHGTW